MIWKVKTEDTDVKMSVDSQPFVVKPHVHDGADSKKEFVPKSVPDSNASDTIPARGRGGGNRGGRGQKPRD